WRDAAPAGSHRPAVPGRAARAVGGGGLLPPGTADPARARRAAARGRRVLQRRDLRGALPRARDGEELPVRGVRQARGARPHEGGPAGPRPRPARGAPPATVTTPTARGFGLRRERRVVLPPGTT